MPTPTIPPPVVIEKADVIDETIETGYKIHHNVTPDAVNIVKSINDAAADRPNLVETDEHREGQNGFAVAEDMSRYLDDVKKYVLPGTTDIDLAKDSVTDVAVVENPEGKAVLDVVMTNDNNEYSPVGLSWGMFGLSPGDVKGDGTSPFQNRLDRTGEKYYGDKIYKNPIEAMKIKNSFFNSLRSSGHAEGFGWQDGEGQALLASKHIWRGGYIGDMDEKAFDHLHGQEGEFMSMLMYSTHFLETGFSQDNYNLGKRSNFHKIGTKQESKGGTDVGAHQINVDERYGDVDVDKKEIARHIDTNYSTSMVLALDTYKSNLVSIQKAVKYMPKNINENFKKHYTQQMIATLAAGGFNGGREGSTKIWNNLGTKAKPIWKVNADYFKALTGDPSAKPIKINVEPSNIGTNIMRQVFTALDFQGENIIGFEDLAKNPDTLPARILNMKITNRGETMSALEYVKKYRPVELRKAKALYNKNNIAARRQDLADAVNYDRGDTLLIQTRGLLDPVFDGENSE